MKYRPIPSAACAFVIVNLLAGHAVADPRPPLPPVPALFTDQFDQPNNTQGAFHAEGIQWVESWSGYALQLDSGFIGWAGASSTYSRQRIVSPAKGTVRFWFRPSTPLVESTLVECATWTGTGSYPWFSIHSSPAGIGVVSGGKIITGARTGWDPGAWHLVAFTYSPTNGNILYLDGQPVAQGPALALPYIPAGGAFGICLGSANGTSPGQGTYEELYTFNYTESPDEIAQYYDWTAPTVALGPITAAELAARAQLRAARQAQLQLQPQLQTMGLDTPMDGPQTIDCISGPLHLTNFVQVASNTFAVTIAGGQPNMLYDVRRTAALNGPCLTNSQWVWVGCGYQCDTITDTNAVADSGFYIAASLNYQIDSDGDGIPDWWMEVNFGHPTGLASDNSRAQDDADGDGLTNLQEYIGGTNPRVADTITIFISEPKAFNLP